jgi:hypothetical protein
MKINLPAAAALAAALLCGCLDSDERHYAVTDRSFFRQIDDNHVFFSETRYRQTCFDGACSQFRNEDFHTRLISMNKATGDTLVLARADSAGIPGYFLFPDLFLKAGSPDSLIKVDCLTGARASAPNPFHFFSGDSASIEDYFLTEKRKYLVTRECGASACADAIYDYAAGTLVKRVQSPFTPLYLDEDSLLLYQSDKSVGPFYYVSKYNVATGESYDSQITGNFISPIRTGMGEWILLFTRNGQAFSYPTVANEGFNSHLKNITDLGAENLSPYFEVKLDSGEYVNVDGRDLFFGNAYKGGRALIFPAYQQRSL